MLLSNKSIDKDSQTSNEATEPKQHLITDEKFKLLRQCQQEIYLVTESSPSLRKLINELITEENLQKVKSKFISVWNS